MNVLLVGNPNVGKSIIFSRLTGTRVTSSNYPNTTVEFTEGYIKWQEKMVKIIDVPGTYSLKPNNRAEEVAVDMLEKGDLIINVVDATNLERNLNLTLQLLERDIPVIVALNLFEEARHKGITIDVDKLQKLLGVPVIPTEAIKGNGIRDLIKYFDYREVSQRTPLTKGERWKEIGRIVEQVQQIHHRHHTWLDWFDELSIRPLSGIPIAFIILSVLFFIIRFIGEGLITYVTEPFFEIIYKPVVIYIGNLLNEGSFLYNILIGQTINGQIDFEQSFGLLTTALFIPLGAVLPYIVSFYLVLGLLEDSGYLPRLAVLTDNVMHRVGLHGFSVIPMVLAFGCNVPAALAIRSLESRREKFITATLMSIAIPCMSQNAMIVSLLGRYGNRYIFTVFGMLFIVWMMVGLILNKITPGFSTDLLLEIPPLRMPGPATTLKKLWMRFISFLREAVPYVLLGVFLVNILYFSRGFEIITGLFGGLFNTIFGVPDEAVIALLLGFLRKDLAVGMLIPLGLSVKQLVIASTVLVIYFPCAATFFVLIRELGIIDMLKSSMIMIFTTLVVGGFLNLFYHNGGISITGWSLILITFFLIYRYLPQSGGNNIKEDSFKG
ncbi:ferrous iron transporter B [Halothermothrix orenii]|uniref:Ferrous iron transporter protein FeoB n=1 Tax=Halothermothrix orenii (strain H 168 / OCM 544 / DSM 9562) TaxID=373903 RepID=B8D238_HALOH|nr:ferrous iron transporter B [Halothermothrix orenii]ACL69265.1 Ferrous iron transporter protein FeoB [Halothermothrix orenii H 168]